MQYKDIVVGSSKPPEQLLAYRVINLVMFVIVIVFNALASTGFLNGNNIGNVSDTYNNSFVPAGWAFSIWGPIYMWMAAFCVYMAVLPKGTEAAQLLSAIGPWFIISCVFNIAWICTFVIGTPLALLVSTFWIFLILIPLLIIIIKINSWRAIRQNLWDLWIVDVTFSMYAGWVTVACIANVTITLTGYVEWLGEPWTAQGWSVLMMSIAAAINVAVLITRRDPVFTFVYSWAVAAIASGHSEEKLVFLSASILSGIMTIGALGVTIYHIVRWIRRLMARSKITKYNPAQMNI